MTGTVQYVPIATGSIETEGYCGATVRYPLIDFSASLVLHTAVSDISL